MIITYTNKRANNIGNKCINLKPSLKKTIKGLPLKMVSTDILKLYQSYPDYDQCAIKSEIKNRSVNSFNSTPIEFIDNPSFWCVMPFGKYKGVPISKISNQYLSWVLINCRNIEQELITNIKSELFKRASDIPATINNKYKKKEKSSINKSNSKPAKIINKSEMCNNDNKYGISYTVTDIKKTDAMLYSCKTIGINYKEVEINSIPWE